MDQPPHPGSFGGSQVAPISHIQLFSRDILVLFEPVLNPTSQGCCLWEALDQGWANVCMAGLRDSGHGREKHSGKHSRDRSNGPQVGRPRTQSLITSGMLHANVDM